MGKERLDKLLAATGRWSRREAKEIIRQGRVLVDGRPAGTCELSPCRTLESSLNLARDKGAEAVLVFDKDGERMVRV